MRRVSQAQAITDLVARRLASSGQPASVCAVTRAHQAANTKTSGRFLQVKGWRTRTLGTEAAAKPLPQSPPGDARRGEAGVVPKRGPVMGGPAGGVGVGWELRMTDGLSAADGNTGLVKLGALPLVPTCPLGPAALLCAASPGALPAAWDLEIFPELGSGGHHSQDCHEC